MAKHTFRVDVHADDFELTIDGKTRRLDFPHVQMEGFKGSSGTFSYDARELVLDAAQIRLDRGHWSATGASAGDLVLRTGDGNVTLQLHRLEFPRGLQVTRAERGVELAAPHVSIGDATFTIEDVSKLRRRDRAAIAAAAAASASAGPSSGVPDSAAPAAASPPGGTAAPRAPSPSPSASGRFRAVSPGGEESGSHRVAAPGAAEPAPAPASVPAAAPAVPPADEPAPRQLRQRYLTFLDSLTGKLDIDLFVDIDLPVISSRKATHSLRIPIRDGSFDFKQLTDQLQGIEGRLLEFERSGDRLILGWGLPLMSTRELVSWDLDEAAMTMAVFDRFPLRSLVDYRGSGSGGGSGDKGKKKGLVTLKALALRRIALEVAMTAPARLDVGDALIQIGDENAPGLLDVKLAGDIVHSGAGAAPTSVTGTVGLLDLTIKDLRLGGATFTTDRIHLGGIENLRLDFQGMRPGKLTGVVSRVAATNVRLVLG
jgi:hypothetical protein